MKWTCSPNYINSPFDKLCLSRVTIVTKLSVTDYRGGACLWERLQQLGGQPDPDHRVHHRLPHPQPGVPRHHHLWPGDPHGHHDPDNVDTQGMATDTLDKVLKERFENWMRSQGLDINSN